MGSDHNKNELTFIDFNMLCLMYQDYGLFLPEIDYNNEK